MSKYLIWVPVIGIFTTMYYQIEKKQHVVDPRNNVHFVSTAIYQSISLAALYIMIW